MDGLAIGGFLSKIACSMILCCAESAWQKDVIARASDRFVPQGYRWQNVVAAARYVDDLLLCS
eukprot:3516409-Pyramimonas_sp.AAC.1